VATGLVIDKFPAIISFVPNTMKIGKMDLLTNALGAVDSKTPCMNFA